MRLLRYFFLFLLLLGLGSGAAVHAYNRYSTPLTDLDAWPDDKADYAKPRAWQPKSDEVIRVLALDGGGVRDLVSLEVLRYIEDRADRPISELFDAVIGTSTGAISATALLLTKDNGQPRYAVEDLIELYGEVMSEVFHTPWSHRVLTLDGLLGPRFPNREKYRLARQVYGNVAFGELLKPTMLLAHSLTDQDLVIFENWQAQESSYYVAPLVVAVTSAPTVFPTVRLQGETDPLGDFVDGGVVANDPAMVGLLRSLRAQPNVEVVLVSIGLGELPLKFGTLTGPRSGELDWSVPLIDILLEGHIRLTSKWLHELSQLSSAQGLHYYRFDAPLPEGKGSWIDPSSENITFLKGLRQSIVETEMTSLDQVIELRKDPDKAAPGKD